METRMRQFLLPEENRVIEYLLSIEYTGYYKNHIIKCWAIDQKCTYDILHTDCKCIVNILSMTSEFTSKDFMNDEYSMNIYKTKTAKNGKAPISESTKKEYDKIFWNIFELLSYTEILEKISVKKSKKYIVKNIDMIKLLASSEEACIVFICMVTYNVILSAGLKDAWEHVVKNPSKMNLQYFRTQYENWMLNTTNHRKDIGQIFQKFVNPLYYLFKLKKYHPIKCNKNLQQSLYDLSYFRQHPRDYHKTYGMTRTEHKKLINIPVNSITNENLYEINQKNDVKMWNQEYYQVSGNNYFSELSETKVITGVHVHHIWPKMEFDATSPLSPNIHENMIVLDQKQHLGYAHLLGNTGKINAANLNVILWKQLEKIEKFRKKNIGAYDLQKFYKLSCFIKSIIPMSTENEEILISYIEDVISAS